MGDEIFALAGILLVLTILAVLQAAMSPRPLFNVCVFGGAFAVWDLIFWGRIARLYQYPYLGPQLRFVVAMISLYAIVVWLLNRVAVRLHKRFGTNLTA